MRFLISLLFIRNDMSIIGEGAVEQCGEAALFHSPFVQDCLLFRTPACTTQSGRQ
jgi:hypothetical protein